MSTRTLLFIVVLLIASLSPFASDIYAPSLSVISKQLHSSITQAQWSMAIYMLGVAVSLLFYGAISEGLGLAQAKGWYGRFSVMCSAVMSWQNMALI